jgi:hypothetical protein
MGIDLQFRNVKADGFEEKSNNLFENDIFFVSSSGYHITLFLVSFAEDETNKVMKLVGRC